MGSNSAATGHGRGFSAMGMNAFMLPVILLSALLLLLAPLGSDKGTAAGDTYYYIPMIYTDAYISDTLTISNLDPGTASVNVDLPGYGNIPCGGIDENNAVQLTLPNLGGSVLGPLTVTSLSGQQLLVSHMVKKGYDYSQAYAVPASQMSNDMLFSYNENFGGGNTSRIYISNPGPGSASVDVYIAGSKQSSFTVDPGTRIDYTGALNSGPVRLVSTNGVPFLASMKRESDGFVTEMSATPLASLTNSYLWPEYDNLSDGADARAFVCNPNATPIYVDVRIGGVLKGSQTIIPGAAWTPSYDATRGGPLQVQAWTDSGRSAPANVFTTLRIQRNGRFVEEYGTPASEVSPFATLAWHDGDPATMLKTILQVANPGADTAYFDVFIGDSPTPVETYAIGPNQALYLPIAGQAGGPVRVVSQGEPSLVVGETIPNWTEQWPNISVFPWYDNLYGLTWLMTAIPEAGSANTYYHALQGTSLNQSPLAVWPGEASAVRYPNTFGGPVRVLAQSRGISLLSERSLFGNSFEEVWATPYDELDSHYYWPWYDAYSMSDWVMVANPTSQNVYATVTVHLFELSGGAVPNAVQSRTLAPGESWPCSFPGLIGGPVEVTGTTTQGSTMPRKLIASQRVLFRGAFNEMPGIPQSGLNKYWAWTWYDNQSAGSQSWLFVGNPNAAPVYVMMMIGSTNFGFIQDANGPAPLAQNEVGPLFIDDFMDGPAMIYGCFNSSSTQACLNSPAPIYASQRSIWGNSFSEISGAPSTPNNTPNAHWTWYDERSAGSQNWVMISNMESSDIYYELRIGGQLMPCGPDNCIIPAFNSATPHFQGMMDGPVQVDTWISEIDGGTGQQAKLTEADILASQRVLWNGYFNEIVGKYIP